MHLTEKIFGLMAELYLTCTQIHPPCIMLMASSICGLNRLTPMTVAKFSMLILFTFEFCPTSWRNLFNTNIFVFIFNYALNTALTQKIKIDLKKCKS